jgi:hypothetical protein
MGESKMKQFLIKVLLASVALAHLPTESLRSQQMTNKHADTSSEYASVDLGSLPPAPQGKSTILGGSILKVDQVRDELSLRVFGQHPVRIFYDERTGVYRDGVRIALRDLGPVDHASVQTILDGTKVFALSIHILSQSPGGECNGLVRNYNRTTGELVVSSALSQDLIELQVPRNAVIGREGQPAFTSASAGVDDLIPGALVSVHFQSDSAGRGIATKIAVLATPGSSFAFSGDLSSLNLSSGLLVVSDPREGKSYQMTFDVGTLASIRSFHEGDHVWGIATYDGKRYVARTIAEQ